MGTVHIGTVVGSVFGNVTQYIQKEELKELKELEELEGVKEVKPNVLDTDQKVLALTPSNSFNSFNSSENIPPELATERAERLRERLEGAGLVDAHWQPVGLSLAEKGVLVQYVAGELGLAAQWKTFARLWGMNPETLRKAYGKGMEQKKTLAFWGRVKGE